MHGTFFNLCLIDMNAEQKRTYGFVQKDAARPVR